MKDYKLTLDGKQGAHGRSCNGDFTLQCRNGQVFVSINGKEHELTDIAPELVLEDGTLLVTNRRGQRAQIKISGDIRILREKMYIHPKKVETEIQKARLCLQEYYLNNNPSEAAHTALLDSLETSFALLDDSYPAESTTLDTIFNLVGENDTIPAIAEMRQLGIRLEHKRPVPCMECSL